MIIMCIHTTVDVTRVCVCVNKKAWRVCYFFVTRKLADKRVSEERGTLGAAIICTTINGQFLG